MCERERRGGKERVSEKARPTKVSESVRERTKEREKERWCKGARKREREREGV